MLPDRSILIEQKLVENAKIQMRHFEQFSHIVHVVLWDNFGDFERLWRKPKSKRAFLLTFLKVQKISKPHVNIAWVHVFECGFDIYKLGDAKKL